MKLVSTESKLYGIAQHLPEMANQMAMVWDVAMNLRNCSDEMTLVQRQFNAQLLEQAYMRMAYINGLDPCEQFDETKARLGARRLRGDINES